MGLAQSFAGRQLGSFNRIVLWICTAGRFYCLRCKIRFFFSSSTRTLKTPSNSIVFGWFTSIWLQWILQYFALSDRHHTIAVGRLSFVLRPVFLSLSIIDGRKAAVNYPRNIPSGNGFSCCWPLRGLLGLLIFNWMLQIVNAGGHRNKLCNNKASLCVINDLPPNNLPRPRPWRHIHNNFASLCSLPFVIHLREVSSHPKKVTWILDEQSGRWQSITTRKPSACDLDIEARSNFIHFNF